ncbi:imm11 family protein [Hahella sp. HN01]|uniref:imm11 family protein n=1 Tax=Hahella sp. HN01 TaxID=2847262 RepID=UPI001C1EE053|nr:DUF1629 domain-containing protein [Hahella sp. HN01]MBU6953573.1 hypothetical protein [Hahella sp. HN01]
MIYRLEIDFNNLPERIYFSAEKPMPFKMDRRPGPSEYKYSFEEFTSSECHHCKLYKAPLLSEWRINVPIETNATEKDIPDILVLIDHIYVSDKVKLLIEKNDPFGHQFWPIEILGENGKNVTDTPFYHMNMRRYLTITNHHKSLMDVDFSPSLQEKEFIPSIQHNASIRKFIELLPLWKHIDQAYAVGSALYINGTMFNTLKSNGVTGINEFTEPYGKQGEMVAHI